MFEDAIVEYAIGMLLLGVVVPMTWCWGFSTFTDARVERVAEELNDEETPLR